MNFLTSLVVLLKSCFVLAGTFKIAVEHRNVDDADFKSAAVVRHFNYFFFSPLVFQFYFLAHHPDFLWGEHRPGHRAKRPVGEPPFLWAL